MKEFLLVSFVIDSEKAEELISILDNLNEDFTLINTDVEFETNELGIICKNIQHLIHGRISSEAATMMVLTYPWVSDHMQISYISDNMKDRYRQ